MLLLFLFIDVLVSSQKLRHTTCNEQSIQQQIEQQQLINTFEENVPSLAFHFSSSALVPTIGKTIPRALLASIGGGIGTAAPMLFGRDKPTVSEFIQKIILLKQRGFTNNIFIISSSPISLRSFAALQHVGQANFAPISTVSSRTSLSMRRENEVLSWSYPVANFGQGPALPLISGISTTTCPYMYNGSPIKAIRTDATQDIDQRPSSVSEPGSAPFKGIHDHPPRPLKGEDLNYPDESEPLDDRDWDSQHCHHRDESYPMDDRDFDSVHTVHTTDSVPLDDRDFDSNHVHQPDSN